MEKTRFPARVLACLLVLLVLNGCSGVEADPPPEDAPSGESIQPAFSDATLSGPYHLVRVYTGSTAASMGTMQCGGNGHYTLAGVYSDSGQGADLAFAEQNDYLIDEEGYMALYGQNNILFAGGVLFSGDFFLYAQVRDAGKQEIGVGLRAGQSGFTDARFTGVFHHAWLSQGSGWTRSGLGKAGFDGAGGFTKDALYAESGLGANLGLAHGGAYALADNGEFSMDGMAGAVLDGGLNPDGTGYVFANVRDQAEQTVGFGVKAGERMTMAGLVGDFHFCTFATDPGGTTSAQGTVFFDGTGAYNLSREVSDSSGRNIPLTRSGTYTMNQDGTFTLTADAEVIQGGLSADGHTFVAARTDQADHAEIWFGARQGPEPGSPGWSGWGTDGPCG